MTLLEECLVFTCDPHMTADIVCISELTFSSDIERVVIIICMRCRQIFKSIQQCRMVTDHPELSHNNFSSCIYCSVVCFDVLGSYYNIPGLYSLALIIACICSLSFTNNSKYLVGTTYFVFIMFFFHLKKEGVSI